MLTKAEIDRYRMYDCGREDGDVYSKCDCPLLRKILDQATAAIDLAAENELLKNTLNSIWFLLQTQNDGADKTSMIRDLMAKHYRQGW